MKNFYTVCFSLVTFLFIQLFSIPPIQAQGSSQVYYETFSGTSFPAGWKSIKDGAYLWEVNQGA